MEILRSELLAHPALSADLLAFHTVRSALTQFYIETPFNIQTRQGSGGRYESAHGDMGVIKCRESYEQRVGKLPLAWFEVDDVLESFRAFLALSSEEKTALQAYVAVMLLKPQLSDDTHADPTLEHVVELAGLDAAKHWTPGASFFTRINKGSLLEIASNAIPGASMALLTADKKSAIVDAIAEHFRAADKDTDNELYAITRAWVPDGM